MLDDFADNFIVIRILQRNHSRNLKKKRDLFTK